MALSRDEKLEVYEALIGEFEDLSPKGKATRYTSMNGNMFSFLSPQGDFAIRLPKDERESFLSEHPDAVVVQYDTVMKDYVGLSDDQIQDAKTLRELFERTVAHARTLKAKPTKRRSK